MYNFEFLYQNLFYLSIFLQNCKKFFFRAKNARNQYFGQIGPKGPKWAKKADLCDFTHKSFWKIFQIIYTQNKNTQKMGIFGKIITKKCVQLRNFVPNYQIGNLFLIFVKSKKSHKKCFSRALHVKNKYFYIYILQF